MIAELVQYLPEHFDYYMLAFVRVAGMIALSTVFGRKNIPGMAKIGYSAVLTLVAVWAFPPAGPIGYTGVVEYAGLAILEFLFGVVVAYVMNVFFSVAAFVSGHIMDMHMGFGMVNVYDVQAQSNVSVTGNLVNLLLLLMFFVLGCHAKMVYMMHMTFEYIPVGGVTLSAQLFETAVRLFSQGFVLALNLAMPFIAAGLLIEIGMGVIIRTVPQMNMFVVGMPLKVVIGLLLLVITIPVYASFAGQIFDRMFFGIEEMWGGMM